jgi:hypothetical protein
MAAAVNGHLDAMKALLDCGANTGAKDEWVSCIPLQSS